MYLWFHDADANLVALDDDSAGNVNSQIDFTVYEGGTYYVAVDSFNAAYADDYRLTVNEYTPVYDDFDPLDTIAWVTQLSSGVIDVYFAPGSYSFTDGYFGTINAESWNTCEVGRFDAAFAMLEAVADLQFNIVTSQSAADLILVMDTNQIGSDGTLGFFNPPDTGSNSGIGVFAGNSWDRSAGGDLEVGGYGFVTIVHELLHGLGFAHPHDNGGSSDIMEGVTGSFGSFGAFGLNQGIYTTMSYNTGWNVGVVGAGLANNGSYGAEAGPMALDIALLQMLYGANTTYNGGNDSYTLAGTNASGTAWTSIWDTNGTDEIRFGGALDAHIDLRAATLGDEFGGGGYQPGVSGIAGGFTIVAGVLIENAVSGSGADTFIFEVDCDADLAVDFDGAEDLIHISSQLADGLTAQEIVANAVQLNSGTVFIDFGGGDTITFTGGVTVSDLDEALFVI